MTEPSIRREVVITGGPCAGKTTALAKITSEMMQRGWRVLSAPEAATNFISGGVGDIATIAADPARFSRFQRAIFNWQRRVRASYQEMADALGGKVLIVYDRAELDGLAYIEADTFRALLAEEGLDFPKVRDSYDAVLHLVTAADGALDAYTLANNAARTETPAEARALDRRTMNAWLGHPRLIVIDNSTSFAEKMERTVNSMLRTIGEPDPWEIERKFVLARVPDLSSLKDVHLIDIEQRYVESLPNTERRVRKMVTSDSVSYVETLKAPGPNPLKRAETESLVDVSRWLEACASTLGEPIIKRRHVFVWNNRRYELDELLSPRAGWLLEVELSDEDEVVEIPPFIGAVTEVTADPTWKNSSIALNG